MIWVGAQRSEIGIGIGHADHCDWSSLVLAIERCGFRDVESATVDVGVVRIVEPETNVQGVDGRERSIGVKSENLIQKNGLDRGLERTLPIRLQVALIPRQPEVREGRVGIAIGEQIAALNGEHIEG